VLFPFVFKFGKEWLASLRAKELRITPFVWVGTALFVSLVLYQSLPYHYRDLARVSGSLQASFETKKELSKAVEQPPFAALWTALRPLLGARTPMYASATAMTLDAPVLGQGTGNFAWVYPSYSNRFYDFRDPLSNARTFTTNPHNIVLQLSTQNGIPATSIFIGLLLFFWSLLVRSLWKSWDTWIAAGLVAISAAIFDAMFNHVFFNPASMFVFALLGGCWWGYVRDDGSSLLTVSVGWWRSMAVVLVVASLSLSIWPVRWIVSEWNVGQAMAHMRQLSIASDYYDRAYAWDRYNFRAVFGKAQSAYQQKRFANAIEYLKHFENIFPYNPPALNMLGASYMLTGNLSEAESAFRRCITILPDFEMAQQNLARVQAMTRSRNFGRGSLIGR